MWNKGNNITKPSEPKGVIIYSVRLQSNAGWYKGSLYFTSFDDAEFYDRDTGYYLSERMLQKEFPDTISISEAFDKVKSNALYRRRLSSIK